MGVFHSCFKTFLSQKGSDLPDDEPFVEHHYDSLLESDGTKSDRPVLNDVSSNRTIGGTSLEPAGRHLPPHIEFSNYQSGDSDVSSYHSGFPSSFSPPPSSSSLIRKSSPRVPVPTNPSLVNRYQSPARRDVYSRSESGQEGDSDFVLNDSSASSIQSFCLSPAQEDTPNTLSLKVLGAYNENVDFTSS
eukprot:GILI01035869.1.p1 GENE.GILI01035869.1~~GILI01035869.1.p1  ORF type:complete len:189 (-),score=14.43 GILI01035869.1:93-659(-)